MGLKKIYMMYHTPRTIEVLNWFYDTFGEPQEWSAIVLEPVQLKHGYQWANGKHHDGDWDEFDTVPVIWCTEKAFMMYSLRWL
jgi:hypothetical protein